MAYLALHFGLAFVAYFIVGAVYSLWVASQLAKYEREGLRDMMLELGVSESEFIENQDRLNDQIRQIQLKKFSPDLFVNRFAQLAGALEQALLGLSWIVLILGVIGVLLAAMEDSENAPLIWLVLILIWILELIRILWRSLIWLLLGRWPGQPKLVRDSLRESFSDAPSSTTLDEDSELEELNSLGTEPDDDLDEEENERQAGILHRIVLGCKMLEVIAGDGDEYTVNRIDERLRTFDEDAEQLTDEFYRLAATHQIINLLVKARRLEDARSRLNNVEDEFFQQRILEDNPELIELN